jgi:hypothetical protein
MPKNTQGGNKHKSGRNSESSTSRRNKAFFEDLMSDIRNSESIAGIVFGRVIGRKGDGRMEVTYYEDGNGHTVNVPITGALRGKGKRDAFIDIGTIVVLTDTGMTSGTSHKITGVLTKQQGRKIQDADPSLMDERLFLVAEGGAAGGAEKEDIFEATAEDGSGSSDSEIDVDNV